MKNTLITGTLILSMSMFLSKVLGFIYVIPFTKMVGMQGYILFEYAYKPYVIMLSLATMGIPMAVSKFVSKYQEMGDYNTVSKLMRSGTMILLGTGIVCAFLLYLASPFIAGLLIDDKQHSGNNVSDVTFVIKTVSTALVVVPVMAIFRGYFQGNQKMAPTAMSQVVEQILRITIILIAAILFVVIGSKSLKLVIGIATIGTTIGAIGSCYILWRYWKKYREEFQLQRQFYERTASTSKSYKEIYKELSYSAIPFVLVSMAVPIYQNIDMFLINPLLVSQGYTQAGAEYVNSIVALVQKVVTIPTIFANAFAITLVPMITQNFIHGNLGVVKEKVTQTMQIILYITLPIGAYFAVAGQPFFATMFGTHHMIYGGVITQSNAVLTVIMSLYFISTGILQGLDKQKIVVVGLILSVIVKFFVSIPLIQLFGGVGTSYSSAVAYTIAIIINFYGVKKASDIEIAPLFQRSGAMIIMAMISMVVMMITTYMMIHYVIGSTSNYFTEFMLASTVGLSGATIYIALSYKFHLIPNEILMKFSSRLMREQEREI